MARTWALAERRAHLNKYRRHITTLTSGLCVTTEAMASSSLWMISSGEANGHGLRD